MSWEFTINPPFWETWWFRLLIVTVLLGGSLSAIMIRDKIRREKLDLELAVLENEQKALTAQINPHFIYNAMNSVQYYVLENERGKAADQLAKFSELMRKVLTNTKNSFISLKSELSILNLYLSLEKERFEQMFEYTLKVDEKLDQERLLVPSMVVQPHIENAIWHGLLHKQNGKGMVSVELLVDRGCLIWKVRDNGVGRKQTKVTAKASLDRDAGYTSSGIYLTRRRLDLLSRKNPT